MENVFYYRDASDDPEVFYKKGYITDSVYANMGFSGYLDDSSGYWQCVKYFDQKSMDCLIRGDDGYYIELEELKKRKNENAFLKILYHAYINNDLTYQRIAEKAKIWEAESALFLSTRPIIKKVEYEDPKPRKGFVNIVVAMSKAKDFEKAIGEWKLILSYQAKKSQGVTCACGQRNIVKCSVIENTNNKRTLILGSNCVKRFMHNIEDISIEVAKDMLTKRVINDWEFGFLTTLNTRGTLTPKQLICYDRINEKIIKKLNLVQPTTNELIAQS